MGALDGKHVVMIAPPNSNSIFFNYKKSHSIVLMAICDADYKFIYVDVGCNGRRADGGVFNSCSFANALNSGALNLPDPRSLPGSDVVLPYVIVADNAFAMRQNLMKPFPGSNLTPSQRVFNYRLSRARRVIENAFGIMSAKFRVMRSPITLDAAKTRQITLACCALHNMLITRKSFSAATIADQYADDHTLIEGIWQRNAFDQTMYPIEHNRSKYITNNALKVREEFEKYFMSTAGEVPWQYKFI